MRLHLPSTGIGSKVQPAGSTIAYALPFSLDCVSFANQMLLLHSTPFNESQPIQSPQSPPSENRTDHAHMLAEKLLNHQKGSIARAPPSLSSRPSTCNSDLTSPSLGNASNRATPGGMTPRSELGSDPEGSFKTPDVPASAVSASKPRELSSTVRQPPYVNPITVGDSPNASRPGSGATTPDRVREQDKVTHIPAEPRSPPANPGSPRPPLGKAHSFGKEAHKQSLKPNGSTGSVHPAEATAKSLSDIRAPSPNKINGRPAVFSAIPPKAEKDASQKDRSHPAVSKERPSMPASGEKKTSVLGKMFGAMKSSEHLHPDQSKDHHHHHHHKDKGKRGRSKHPHREGDSEYESESGAESDVSAASAVSSSAKSDRGGGFFGMKRRGSGGKKQDHFRGTEQDKAAALAAGRGKDGQSSHPADSIAVPAPPLSRRSSEKKHGDKHSESGSAVGNIGQSLKDMVTGPLMQRKPSMQS